nr:unnamed protein product [Callosobruchus chinensis]
MQYREGQFASSVTQP